MGPAGSGKGTQADMLGEKLGLPVISPGELLRHERDKGTAVGKRAARKMAKGVLVPDDIVESVIEKRLKKKDALNGVIFDGYPRRFEQLGFLEKNIRRLGVKRTMVFYIDAGDEKIKKRISGRRVCDCGAAYHLKNNPPRKKGVCDECGARIYQRKDDRPEILAGRLKRFHKRNAPLIDYFRERSDFIKINGNKSIKEVKADICRHF